MLLTIILLYLSVFIKKLLLTKKQHYYSQKIVAEISTTDIIFRSRKKPDWVIHEIIKIKALMPHASCRIISLVFNKRFKNKESVGKTFVNYTILQNLYEIQILRKKIKSRPAHAVPFSKVWGIDLTFVQQKPVLGVIEHHSRKALGLIPLKQKSSIVILRALLNILDNTPAPQFIRSDNEICFNSKLMKFGFWVLGIKHQTIDKHCPWQNGRIERFFGTLKTSLANTPEQSDSDLLYLMHSFEFWYNHIRFHQNIQGKTPEFIYQKRIREW